MANTAPETDTPYSPNLIDFLPPLQWLLMTTLHRTGPLGLSALAEEVDSHVSTVGGAVTTLRLKGCVAKLKDGPNTGRCVLTTKGGEALRKHFALHTALDPFRRSAPPEGAVK